MNRYEVTLFKKDALLETVNSGFPDGDCMDKYCKTIKVDVPVYLIRGRGSRFLEFSFAFS